MLLLQSRGWQLNNRNFNRAGEALGDLLRKALSPDEPPERRKKRTPKELMDAMKGEGYYGVMTEEERLAPYDKEKVQAKIEERQLFEDTVHEPGSLNAFYKLHHPDKETPEEKAIFESQLKGDEAIAWKKQQDLLEPEKREKSEWQFDYDEDKKYLWKKNIYTKEKIEYRDDAGKRVLNPDYTNIDKIEYKDGEKFTHYKDNTPSSKSQYYNKKTGKFNPKVLDKLKFEATQLSNLGTTFRSADLPETIDRDYPNLDRASRAELKRDYTKKRLEYNQEMEAMEGEIMGMIDNYEDNQFVQDLVAEVRAVDMDEPPVGPFKNKKQEMINYFYDELKAKYDELNNPHVMEVIMMGYHEILFGESFQQSERAMFIRDNARNGTQ